MKQLITRIDESLADAVKERAQLNGESVNAYVTRLLRSAVQGRAGWKSDAVAAGRLLSRPGTPAPELSTTVSTPAGYASDLVSAERDER